MTVTKLLIRLPAAIAVPFLAAVLVACAPPVAAPSGPSMDLATAKQFTRGQQDELLSVVPPAAVSTTKQSETSRALFDCENGGYYWPGTMDVALSANADGAALLEQIKVGWSAKAGWTVRDKTSVNGDPELIIVSQEGYWHSIEFNPKRNALNVLSSSACFTMDGKPEPGVDY